MPNNYRPENKPLKTFKMNTIIYFIQNHAINYNLILSDIAPYCSFLIILCIVLLQVKISGEENNNQEQPEEKTTIKEPEKTPEKTPIAKNPDSSLINQKIIERLKEFASIVFIENSHLFQDKSRWTIGELNNYNYTLDTFDSVEQIQTIEVESFQMSIDLCQVFRILYRFSKLEKTDKIYFDLPEKEQEKTFGLGKYVNKKALNECERFIFVDTENGYKVTTDRYSIKIVPAEKTEKQPYFIDSKGFAVEAENTYPKYLNILPQKGVKIHIPKEVFNAVRNCEKTAQISINLTEIKTSIVDIDFGVSNQKVFKVENNATAEITLKNDQIRKILAEKITDFYLCENGFMLSINDSICGYMAKNEDFTFSVNGTAENINYSTGERKTIRLRTVKNDFASEVSEKTNVKIKEIA